MRKIAFDLKGQLKYWRGALSLDEWDIRAVFSTDIGTDHGQVEILEPKQMALVKLRPPAPSAEMRPYDPEVALVHELLHVRFPSFCGQRDGDHFDITAEQGIHALSQTLVRLARSAKRKRRCSIRTRSS